MDDSFQIQQQQNLVQKWNLIAYGFSLFIYSFNIFRVRSVPGFVLRCFVYGYYLVVLQLELSSFYPSWKKINMNKLLTNCSFLESFVGRGFANLLVTMIASRIRLTRGFFGEVAFLGNIAFSIGLITCEFKAHNSFPKPLSYNIRDFMVDEQDIITNSESRFTENFSDNSALV
ncbi:hypothetical protein ACO0QE_004047 [Hanseniaspora vineae]